MIYALGYFICYVLAYLLFKKAWSYWFNEWTVENRRVMLILSVGGPFSLVAAIFVFLMEYSSSDDDKPASW